MTPLRKKMIQAMQQRRFSPRTCESYLYSLTCLSRYFARSPDTLKHSELQRYFDYLVQEKQLAAASCLLQLNAIRFFYLKVLGWSELQLDIVVPKRPQAIPELLTRDHVVRIIDACTNEKHRMMLQTCYGCGLRVSELVAVKVRDIDGERHLLKVVQGKGRKDRMVIIGQHLLDELRSYWQRDRPEKWLFPSNSRDHHLCTSTLQRSYKQAKTKAGIDKEGGIHALRHAYATHQLQAGMPVIDLQYQMGHRHVMTTLRYLHWVPDYKTQEQRGTDLLAQLRSTS